MKKDPGFRSRKWAAFVFTSVAIIVVGATMGHEKVDGVVFGLISALGLYLGGNVSNAWVDAKHAPGKTEPAPAPAPKPPVTPKKDDEPEEEEEGA